MTLLIIFIVIDVIAAVIAIAAQTNINNKYNKYAQASVYNGLTGKDVAERILRDNQIDNISVNAISGKLSDHYNHRKKELNLSQEIYNGSTIAAIAVAAHEAGHAIQYKKRYVGIGVRNFVITLSNIISTSTIPLLIIGILFSTATLTLFGTNMGTLFIYIALISYGATTLASLVTLPVEFDASKRAMEELRGMNILDEDELDGTKSMLTAAALTYVANLAVNLIYLLRFVIILLLHSRDWHILNTKLTYKIW